MRLVATLLLLFGLLAIGLLCDTPQLSTAHSLAPAMDAAPNRGWPHPIPLRVRDGANRDLMVMTLGDVETALAEGMYDPTTDEATLKDGSIIKNYYREKLGVKYFKAIDKTNFPLPHQVGAPGITTISRLMRRRSSRMPVGSRRTSRTTERNTFR